MKKLLSAAAAVCLLLAVSPAVLAAPAEKPAEKAPKPTVSAVSRETKPAETKAAETKPAETKPAETKPAETKPAETKAAETKPAETKPAETKPAEKKPAETKAVETKPAETKPAEAETAAAETAGTHVTKTGTGEEAEQPRSHLGLYLGLGAGSLGILIAIIVAVAGKKKKHTAGIPMRLEVHTGNLVSDTGTLYLSGELLIGSSRDCQIVFEDRDMAPRNCRIFQEGNLIYIEDLNSPRGTCLGGMRLFRKNRLRSGDVITVGDVCFRLLF